MKVLSLIFKINKLVKNNHIRNIVFVDSFGGMHHLFYILQELISSNKKFLIICSNKDSYLYLKKIKKIPNNLIYYRYTDNLLSSFLKILPLIFLRFLMNKVDNFYSYKLVVDPIRYLIINIFFNKSGNIKVFDQFINYYKFENKIFYKKKILEFLNFFLIVKLRIYKHRDLDNGMYLSIDKKFNNNIKNYSWQDINNFFFKYKIKPKKKNLILIDDTIHLLIKLNYINFKSSKKKMGRIINSFIIRHKIKDIFIKKHPDSKRINILSQLVDNRRVRKINTHIPLELLVEDFEYCLFTASSAFYYKCKTKLFNISHKMNFNNLKFQRNYFYLLKKTSKKNFKKINFL